MTVTAPKLRPLGDRLVVEPRELETKTKGGIVLPDNATEKPIRGKVVAVGTGKYLDDGQLQPLQVKVGNEILFGKYSGTTFKLDEKDLLVMREEDVLGIIE